MQIIDREMAERLLAPLGMSIGSWNELRPVPPFEPLHTTYLPPSGAMELYVASHRLAAWIVSGSWTLLQVDNSTSPTDDEVAIFENLVLAGQRSWDVAEQHTFLIDELSRRSVMVLLIYFSLLFAWHIHLTSEDALSGKRLALQDGVAYLFGSASAIQSAEELVRQLAENPRAMAP